MFSEGGEELRLVVSALCGVGLVYLMRMRFSKRKGKGGDGLAALDAVGGHGSKKGKGPPILATADGIILKPFQPAQPGRGKSRGEMEADFYKMVTESSNPIKPFIPKYFGRETVGDSVYLKMENLTHGMIEPCVLDLKMGQKTYDEDASQEKIARERKKYPPQEEIGFRIVGMKVFRASTGETWKSERKWCMGLTAETMPKAIEQFFFDGRVVRYHVIEELIEKLEEIENMLSTHPQWRMYGSSLLVVYDGASDSPPKLCVRMIDFAHIFDIKDGGVDDGYIHGLRFLKMCLVTAIAHAGQPAQVGGAHGNIASSGGEIIKKEDKKDQFDTEVAFYEKAWGKPPDALSRVMPKLVKVNTSISPRELVISDATCLVKPSGSGTGMKVSIMDVKLGKRSFRADCPNDPQDSYFSKYAAFEQELSPGRAEEIWKSICGSKSGPTSLKEGKLGKRHYLSFRDATTTSTELGFRLTALVHGDYKVSQNDSRSIETKVQFLERLEHFLYNEKGFDISIASQFVEQLNGVLHATSDSKLFQEYEMVGTSLLFLHCGNKAAIRWIDFANCYEARTGDHNGITEGIHLLSMAIEELILKYQS